MKLHYYFLWFMQICMMGILAFLLIMAWWLWGPYRTLEINNYTFDQPIPVQTPIVHAGDVLSYRLDYCKYADITSTVHRTLVDGQIITLIDAQGNLPLGCHSAIVSSAVVPETINPGKYYLNVEVDYRVNILRTIRVHYATGYFEVVPPYKISTSKPPPIDETIHIIDPQSATSTQDTKNGIIK